VLDTKYEGAVAVNVWPGYAVLITRKTGERRVELGPKMVLLEYDETLMPLSLSTGRPKTDAKHFHTAYLRVQNNQVGDIVTVETKDLVKVNVEISYRVNFEGTSPEDQQKWFNVEDYVKILTDHCRSRLRNEAKRHGIQEFYTNTIDLVRNTILGAPAEGKRTGLIFVENGMRVYDVEILNVMIEDPTVARLLIGAQEVALSGAIKISAAEEEADRTEKMEELKRRAIDEKQKTSIKEAEVDKATVGRVLEQRMAEAQLEFVVVQGQQKVQDSILVFDQKTQEQKIELNRKNATQEIERLQAETSEYVKRINAVNGDMIAALGQFGDKLFIEKLVEAVGPLALAQGVTTIDVFNQVFKGTPFEGAVSALASRPYKDKVLTANTRKM
jgi:major vault protein